MCFLDRHNTGMLFPLIFETMSPVKKTKVTFLVNRSAWPGKNTFIFTVCYFSLNLARPKKNCISKNVSSENGKVEVQCAELSGKSLLLTVSSHSPNKNEVSHT